MRNELFAMVSAIAWLAGCAAEPVSSDSDTSAVESGLTMKSQDMSCAGAETFGELALLSCKLGEPVDQDGLTLAEHGPVAAPGESSTLARRTYTGGCTGWGGCSRVAAEGWEFMACGAFLYAYETFEGNYGNLIGAGTGFCLF